MLQVLLRPGLPGGKWAYLRPLCGRDEIYLGHIDPVAAIAFLDRLLVEVPGTTVSPGAAGQLAVCDCDRLFAAIYLEYFGEQVESTVACVACKESFELSFALRDLMADFAGGTTDKAEGPDPEGTYMLRDGRRFRLPTAEDRHSVMGVDAGEAVTALLARCVVEGDATSDSALLQAAMDEVGGVLDLDLDATCPECATVQTVRFDIQDYVLRALASERRFLSHEIHHIATVYGWGYQEILDLTREDRRSFVRLIEADRTARRRMRS